MQIRSDQVQNVKVPFCVSQTIHMCIGLGVDEYGTHATELHQHVFQVYETYVPEAPRRTVRFDENYEFVKVHVPTSAKM